MTRLDLPGRPAWMARAACAGMHPETFHPHERRGQPPDLDAINTALATCARCPVRAECLEYALTHREDHGIWGGMTARQRLRIARRTGRIVCAECGVVFTRQGPGQRVCSDECRRARRSTP